ncbi:hypothetical protein B4109_1656 [Geobacillus stearothermophilus]|uniref:Uncharacterized protein n=1 Tax=Geobacillus stearothermophilus TaxID=1422 RepID=A0A150MSU7_GEOSE|nr:hypothetical protein B4109_1656 [Geobacillus stearothermophilus]
MSMQVVGYRENKLRNKKPGSLAQGKEPGRWQAAVRSFI